MRRWPMIVLAAATAACAGDSAEPAVRRANIATAAASPDVDSGAVRAADHVPVSVEDDLAAVLAASREYSDSIDSMLRRVPYLSRQERSQLRRDLNDAQVERARQIGVEVVAEIAPLVHGGRLVRLPDTTKYWIIRELDYSEPYVTPDALVMLMEIGRRFHARLDSLGVARYRLDVTSLLRTPEKQAQLRRRNSNAARDESAHQFGTTVDISYRRFAAPVDPLPIPAHPSIMQQARLMHDSLLVDTGRVRGLELRAVLGRVLRSMQQEGKLLVRMERRQPVYHITVARRMPQREIASAH